MADEHPVFEPGPSAHGPDCTLGDGGGLCARCAGFQPGHELSTKHGAYAVVGLQDEAREVAERIREVVPVVSPADEVAIEGLAVVTVRIRRAAAAIQQVDETADTPLLAYVGETGQTLDRLRADLRRWLALSLRFADALGLTPTSRARLGLDLARGKSLLDEYVEHTYGRDVVDGGEVVDA